ncbi:Gfo/Idh/MocA family protein [Terriglobus aquaticus]|uniref:Gfo/Idh/MocA family protein n=1 Tax=Terriglobus aquaticus TaxID=940139 RepID=A0ABW9KRM1_9BACT|nr:Gfo/Idh/MocA family oxidoreductase [Terriglobus aquaticus]
MIDLGRLWGRRNNAAAGPDAFGYAVVGLGRIAEHFLRGIQDSPFVRATALVSGDSGKAAKLAKQYGVPFTCGYADFESLREREDVQAVYLALPVSMHREFTERAARIGKHVFVEKPMASDAAECRAMVDVCRSAGVLLSVAYRCPFDPMHQRLQSLIAEGALGHVESIESSFGFKLAADDWRWNNDLAGGGSAYDVGVYPLNAARFLMRAEPEITSAAATVSPAGMESSIAWTMRFPNGAEARCSSSYLQELPNVLRVRGSAGELTLDPAYTHRVRLPLRGWITDPVSGKRVEINDIAPSSTPSHFRLEAEHLAECARVGEPVITSGEDGLQDMELIEQMYATAGVSRQAVPR